MIHDPPSVWSQLASILLGLALIAVAFGWSRAYPNRLMMVVVGGSTVAVAPPGPGLYDRQHWTIRNDGASPLKLRTHFTSRRSGFSLWLGQERIMSPGEELEVALTWRSPGLGSRPFSELAEVWTNDPATPKVRFQVVGISGPLP